MRKKMLLLVCTCLLLLVGCATPAPVSTAPETKAPEKTKEETKAETKEEATQEPEAPNLPAEIRIGALKGATSMGLAGMQELPGYAFVMETAADAMMTRIIKGEVDIALIPANVAANLYAKTQGEVIVIDINTLSVLHFVSGDASIASAADLEGRTVYLTGKGTTPDYVMQYLMKSAGLENVILEFKSEPTEVVAVLAESSESVGLLPQPFVTTALLQNQSLACVLSVNELWGQYDAGGSRQVTGVTVVRKGFWEAYGAQAVTKFLADHKESVRFVNENPSQAATIIESLGIVGKAAIAEKAIPGCAISAIAGEEMREALSGYLQVLFELNPASVGGAVPADDFYFIP